MKKVFYPCKYLKINVKQKIILENILDKQREIFRKCTCLQ